MKNKDRKWSYTSIKRELMKLRSDWGDASKCSIGWTGYHHVKTDNDFELERKSNLAHNNYTWHVNGCPVVLNRKHHYELDALIWRMDKWDTF